MGFKDPYHVEYSNVRDITNTIKLESKVQASFGGDVDVNTSASSSKYFTPLSESVSLGKYTEPQKTGIVGEPVSFRLSMDFRSVSHNRYMKIQQPCAGY